LVERIRVLEGENAELVHAATRQARGLQEIEAENMDLRVRLVAAQHNLRVLISEQTTGPS
jgi:hypothetical protein